MVRQPLVGQGLLPVEVSRSHSDTPHAVGLLWAGDRPVAETSTWQHTTDRNPCHQRNSNPQSQQPSGCRPTRLTARPLRPAKNTILQSL